VQLIQQSEGTAAYRRLYLHAVDASDGIAAETGLTGTGYVSKNGGTPAASSGSLVEISSSNMPGRYYVELTATEVNTLGLVEYRYKAAACAEIVQRAMVVPFDPYDSVRLGLTALPNAAAEAAGGLFTRGTGAGQINQGSNGLIDVNVEQWVDSVVNALQTGRVDAYVGAMATDVITAAALSDGAGDEIADQVWDEVITGHATADSFGLVFDSQIDGLRTYGDGAWATAVGFSTHSAADVWSVGTREITGGTITTVSDKTGYALSAAGVDAIWDEVITGHATADSFGLIFDQQIDGLRTYGDGAWATAVGFSTHSAADVWTSGTRTLTALGFVLANTDAAWVDGSNRVDVGTWLGVAPNALQSGRVDAYVGALAAGVITDAGVGADAYDKLLERDIDQVEATAATHSLCTAILKAVSRVRDNAGTLETYRTNGTTIQLSQAVTTDSGLDPVDELGVGT